MKTSKNINQRFQQFVLRQYHLHGRHELPWRQTEDSYRILVSELMLQQTQVERVIPKYQAFLAQFPTIESLAIAPLSQVLTLWQGLGYNRRAKFLWQTAKVLHEQNPSQPKLPNTAAELQKLPGIGPYTAAAVMAFAHNHKEIVIETNIRTVFLYHFFPLQEKVSDAELTQVMHKLEPTENPREWYWALMDYGAKLKKLLPNPSRKSKHHIKQSKFVGSLRQVRGEIIRLLSVHGQLSTDNLKNMLQSNQVHFLQALAQLVTEQLILQENNNVRLAE